MPTRRTSYRVGDDYIRGSIPGEYQRKQAIRRMPGGQAITYYTPPHRSFNKEDLLQKLAEVRTRTIRLDLVGYLKNDARYKPDDYHGDATYLSRNIPHDVLYIYERLRTTTDMGNRIRDFLNDLSRFDFVVIDEVRFVERGRPQHSPILASRYASDKKAGRV